MASKWGSALDDSTVHALVQRVGQKAVTQQERRQQQVPQERCPQRKPSELGVLLVDGWQVRQRGPGWGLQKTQQNRVEWHEMKMGVYYQVEQAGVKENGRGELVEKVVVSTLGEPLELDQRLHWEAQRAGLGRARQLEVLGDVWRRGFGICSRSAGPRPWRCWIFIMAANMSGSWAGRSAAKRRPRPG